MQCEEVNGEEQDLYAILFKGQNAVVLRLASQMLDAVLMHLLEHRHVVEANEGYSNDVNLDIKLKLWSHLQSLLKSMLAASLPDSGTGRRSSLRRRSGQWQRQGDTAKLKEMYHLL